jgi:hypothetical protein
MTAADRGHVSEAPPGSSGGYRMQAAAPVLLLVFGLVVMFVFYTIWGLYEIMSLPQATLP